MFDFVAISIGQNTSVCTFIFLFQTLDTQNGLATIPIRPWLESTTFHGQIFEPFEPFYFLGRWIAKNLQKTENGFFFGARPLVAWFINEFTWTWSFRLEWSSLFFPALKILSKFLQMFIAIWLMFSVVSINEALICKIVNELESYDERMSGE